MYMTRLLSGLSLTRMARRWRIRQCVRTATCTPPCDELPAVRREQAARDGGKPVVSSEPKPHTAAAQVGLQMGHELLHIDGAAMKQAYAQLRRAEQAPVHLKPCGSGEVALPPRFTGKRTVGIPARAPLRGGGRRPHGGLSACVRAVPRRRRRLEACATCACGRWHRCVGARPARQRRRLVGAMLHVASAFMCPGAPATASLYLTLRPPWPIVSE